MDMTKRRVLKNLLVLSFSFLSSFAAVTGLGVLQSTLNKEVGVVCLAVEFTCGCLAALVLPKYLIKKFGSKTIIVVSLFCNVPFIAANFYPHFIVMVPASIVIGFSSTLVWNSLNTYLNDISTIYAQLIISNGNKNQRSFIKGCHHDNNLSNSSSYNSINENCANYREHLSCQNKEVNLDISNTQAISQGEFDAKSMPKHNAKILETTTARFFGFFGFVSHGSTIFSGIISFIILMHPDGKTNHFNNGTCSCGAQFCGMESDCIETSVKFPDEETKFILITIYLVMSIFSALLPALCVDNIKSTNSDVAFSCDMALSTIKFQLKRNQILLIPLSLYIGMIQAFMIADFTKAFVGCAWGITNIASITFFYGVAISFSSGLFGSLEKRLGRSLIFIITAVLNLAFCATMLTWIPDGNKPEIIVVVAMMGGTVEGVYWSGLRAFVGIIFKDDEEVAYGSYQLWHAFGSALSFAYSSYLCNYFKIYMLILVSTCGIIGYLAVERSHLYYKRNLEQK